MPTSAPGSAATVYLRNTAGWDECYVYVWTYGGTNNDKWPGEEMVLVDEENGVYSFTYDTSVGYYKIIFNDNNGTQTGDLDLMGDGYIYDNGTGTWEEFTDITPTPTATPEPTATDTPTPTATPEPTATDTPTPTATPEPTATDTPTPTVTPEPTATNTPTPTATPEPTATDTPNPTATPEPAATATPTPTATAAVQTGDASDSAVWIMLIAVMCAATAAVMVSDNKRA